MVEAVEEVAAGSQDLPHIVKGKRTKRQRPQSPIPFTITTQYSSSGEGGCVSNGDNNCTNININNNNTNTDTNNNINNNYNNSSSSSAEDQAPLEDHASNEEDEYTAKCLILLAQGGDFIKEPPRTNRKFDQHQDYVTEKFNSKRYIEAPISGNGAKAGMYVYECKTCGRTFPSFQALGGHRASHKKPKNMASAAAEERRFFLELSDDEEEITIFKKQKTHHNNASSLSLELLGNSNRGTSSHSNNMNLYKSASFPKIHECAHCGAEFPSGQALGGHMRRHRGAPVAASTVLSLFQLSPETMDQDSDDAEAHKRTSNGLSLDLNLPAPEDDHHNKDANKFSLASKQHQQQKQRQQQEEEETKPTLVLSSTPKLVHCHY